MPWDPLALEYHQHSRNEVLTATSGHGRTPEFNPRPYGNHTRRLAMAAIGAK